MMKPQESSSAQLSKIKCDSPDLRVALLDQRQQPIIENQCVHLRQEQLRPGHLLRHRVVKAGNGWLLKHPQATPSSVKKLPDDAEKGRFFRFSLNRASFNCNDGNINRFKFIVPGLPKEERRFFGQARFYETFELTVIFPPKLSAPLQYTVKSNGQS